jgi:hypothetical protein
VTAFCHLGLASEVAEKHRQASRPTLDGAHLQYDWNATPTADDPRSLDQPAAQIADTRATCWRHDFVKRVHRLLSKRVHV